MLGADQRTLQSLSLTESSDQAESETMICLKTQADPMTKILKGEMEGPEATGIDAMAEMGGTAAREKGPGKVRRGIPDVFEPKFQ